MPEVGKLFRNRFTGVLFAVSEVIEDQACELHLFYYHVAGLENGEFTRHTITPNRWESSYYEVDCVA